MKLSPVYAPSEHDINEVLPYLERALEHTKDWDMDAVFKAIRGSSVLLLRCLDDAGKLIGAGVVTVDRYPVRNVLTVHLFGADQGTGWETLLWDLRAFARKFNCKTVRGFGREGWARKIKAKPIYGWEVSDD